LKTRRTKITFAASAFAIFFLLLGNGLTFVATAATDTNPGIPAGLLSYGASILGNPDASHCVSGTVNPFTIESTICNTSGAVPQTIYTNCGSSGCQNGGVTTYSSGYGEYQTDFNAPSNPTVSPSYSISTSFSDWIGIQYCTGSCSGTNYLIQAGEAWGITSTYTSSNPTVFVEFYETSGTCSSYCGNVGTFTVNDALPDSLYFQIYYSSSTWYLYAQDSTSNKYTSYLESVGSASGDIPYSSMDYGMAVSEGQGTTASNQIPGGATMYDVVGEKTGGSYVIGSGSTWNLPSTGTQTVSLFWGTGTCSWGSGTCGAQDITVS
jgi:hypothetical protein